DPRARRGRRGPRSHRRPRPRRRGGVRATRAGAPRERERRCRPVSPPDAPATWKHIQCATCGSWNAPAAAYCWMCHADPRVGGPARLAPNQAPPPAPSARSGWSGPAFVAASVLVFLGLLVTMPGLGLVFAIVIAPVVALILRTGE